MSQHTSQPGTPGGFSRIPLLSSSRNLANSRVPSPPLSPGISSPSTPQAVTAITPGNNLAPWGTVVPCQAREKLVWPLGGKLVPGLMSPNGLSVRGPSAHVSVSRNGSVRASYPGPSRTPISQIYFGAVEAAPPPSPPFGGPIVPEGLSISRSSIQVAVRVRPLCEKERQRGDRIAWEADRDGNVGLVDPITGSLVPKHRFDTIFGPESDNGAVTEKMALPLVAPALLGVNATIFAYGVTSSGKTHTMMGTQADPGIVPRVVRELFLQIATVRMSMISGSVTAPRAITVKMSIMEIYNEVLNDLLDPARANLKVREDSRSGLVVVEGLLEQVVTSAEQALEFIARGDDNRKVSVTAFNDDSSRSHTITRIIVESTFSAPSSSNDLTASASTLTERFPGRRTTTACISLIDLAGSESARAVVSKGQRMEGSFINRSLLTLGTVIHKLAAGAAGHIPFRDSKLTRLLQPSLSGPGARVAVVCNITPSGAQTDETSNTLKFAARAKLIQVTARTNEFLDERMLLRRYQKEVADLKRQLVEAKRLLSAAGLTGTEGCSGEGLLSRVSFSGSIGALDGGLGTGKEAVATELLTERDARRRAEVECTMLRIKLTRLQAYLEENGVNVDDLLGTVGGTVSSSSAGLGGEALRCSNLPLSQGALNDATSLLEGPQRQLGQVVNASGIRPAVLQNPLTVSQGLVGHSSSTQRVVSGDRCPGVIAQAPTKPLSEPLRTRMVGGADATEFAAEGRVEGWSNWAAEQAGPGVVCRQRASCTSSPCESELVTVAANETSVDLRAQVAAVLSTAAGVGCGDRSVSGTGSGSELEVDEDLNEGIMAQIRDMISEARLSSPTPPSVASQPVRTHGDYASTNEASIRRSPSADTVPPSTAAAGAGAGRGSSILGGFSSMSSHHRRSVTLSTTSSSYGPGHELDMELELQVMNADREVLHDQLVASEAANERMTAQVAEMRRTLAMYEQLTRHASSELAEIRRLKDAFQARLQRENDLLRFQLLQLGVTPASPTDRPQSQGQVVSGVDGDDVYHTSSLEGSKLMRQAPPQIHAPKYSEDCGVQSMEAFGSPAAVAPIAVIQPAAAPSGSGLQRGLDVWSAAARVQPKGRLVVALSAGGGEAMEMPSSALLPLASVQSHSGVDASMTQY